MNLINMENRFKRDSRLEGREISVYTNKINQSIHIYKCLFMGDVKYRLRKVKDNSLIGEFDSNINLLGDIKTVVDMKELDKAMEQLSEAKLSFDNSNQLFGFDKIAHMLK